MWFILVSIGTDSFMTSLVHVRCHHPHQQPFPPRVTSMLTRSVHPDIPANSEASRRHESRAPVAAASLTPSSISPNTGWLISSPFLSFSISFMFA